MLLKIKNRTYVGLRYLQHLPTRGQRTHANAKTPKKLHAKHQQYPFPILPKKQILSKKAKKGLKAKNDKLAKKENKKAIKKKQPKSKKK